jgi:hypothetical protein
MTDADLFRTCPKCGRLNEHRMRYVAAEPGADALARAHLLGQHYLSVFPEHLEVICIVCGYATKHPCADAPAGTVIE